jgi:hypothetical protein
VTTLVELLDRSRPAQPDRTALVLGEAQSRMPSCKTGRASPLN